MGGRKRAPSRVPLAERDRERIAAAPCGPQRGIRAGQRSARGKLPEHSARQARQAGAEEAGGGIRLMPGGGRGRGRRQEGSWSSGASDARAHALFLTLSILSMPVTCLSLLAQASGQLVGWYAKTAPRLARGWARDSFTAAGYYRNLCGPRAGVGGRCPPDVRRESLFLQCGLWRAHSCSPLAKCAGRSAVWTQRESYH